MQFYKKYKARQDKKWKNEGSRHGKWEKSQRKSKIGCGSGTGIWWEENSTARKNDDVNVSTWEAKKVGLKWRGLLLMKMTCHRPTSPMPHSLIIVDTDVVFPLPNSRLYHNQRNANIPVSSATTFMCSSSWSMKEFDQAVDVATMFTCTLFPPHRICIVYMWVISIADDNVDQLLFCCGTFHDCFHIRRRVSIVSCDTSLLLLSWLVLIDHSSYLSNIPTYCSSYGETSGKTEWTAHGIYRPGKGVR